MTSHAGYGYRCVTRELHALGQMMLERDIEVPHEAIWLWDTKGSGCGTLKFGTA